ncbi:MAG: hypothetical protein HYY84_20860 [Deltaproteobacteria bacterium]|nr:hypothetical protein [Deltaproteobacteria bacterium]
MRVHKGLIEAPLFVVLAGAIAFPLSCGRTAIDWRNHVSFKAKNKEITVAHTEGDEVVKNKIRTNLDYVAISLDSAFFRNLPGLGDAEVAFGLSMDGIRSDQKPVRTVLDVRKGVGGNAFLSFDNLLAVEPFLYTGQNVTLTLQFQAIPDKSAPTIKAQVDGQKSFLRKIIPFNTAIVDKASELFGQVMNAVIWQKLDWKYSVTFFSADRIYREKPDLLFTAGRYIIIAIPPANASGFEHITATKLLKRLRLRGNRLVDLVRDEEYYDTPYVVINITRFKRYPATQDSKLFQTLKQMEEHIENQNWEMASSTIVQLPAIITADAIITSREKNFYRTQLDIFKLRMDVGQAKKNNQAEPELQALMKLIEKTYRMVAEFGDLSEKQDRFNDDLFEPHEYQNFAFQANQWVKRAEELHKDSGKDPAELKKLEEKLKMLLKKGAVMKPSADTPIFFVPYRVASNSVAK